MSNYRRDARFCLSTNDKYIESSHRHVFHSNWKLFREIYGGEMRNIVLKFYSR